MVSYPCVTLLKLNVGDKKPIVTILLSGKVFILFGKTQLLLSVFTTRMAFLSIPSTRQIQMMSWVTGDRERLRTSMALQWIKWQIWVWIDVNDFRETNSWAFPWQFSQMSDTPQIVVAHTYKANTPEAGGSLCHASWFHFLKFFHYYQTICHCIDVLYDAYGSLDWHLGCFHFLTIFILRFKNMSLPVPTWIRVWHMYASAQGIQKKTPDSLEPEPGSSARTACALNRWAIAPVPP